MRREVVEHDVAQLEARLRKGAAPQGGGDNGGGGNRSNGSNNTSRVVGNGAGHGVVTVGDFETLIHQCRKRKWPDEVTWRPARRPFR